jgi:hypothetical protein
MFFLNSQVHQKINVHSVKTQNVVKNITRYEMSLALKNLEIIKVKFSLSTPLRYSSRGIAALILDLSSRLR